MPSPDLKPAVGSGFVAYVRTVKTASGATAVQIVYSNRRGSQTMDHVGSAHDEAEVEALKAGRAPAARGRAERA